MHKNKPTHTYSGAEIIVTLNSMLPTPTKNALRVASQFVPALNRLARGDWGDVEFATAERNSTVIKEEKKGQKVIGVYGALAVIGITGWSQRPETRTHILNPKIMLLNEALQVPEYREILLGSLVA